MLRYPGGAHMRRCPVCREIPVHANAYPKVQKWICDVEFPGNWFVLGINENDFSSATIWAIQIQLSFPELKNPQIPGIQPRHVGNFRTVSSCKPWSIYFRTDCPFSVGFLEYILLRLGFVSWKIWYIFDMLCFYSWWNSPMNSSNMKLLSVLFYLHNLYYWRLKRVCNICY